MAKRRDAAPAAVATSTPPPQWFTYTGPHPLIGRATLVFVRDEPREVPAHLVELIEGQDDMRVAEPPRTATAPADREPDALPVEEPADPAS